MLRQYQHVGTFVALVWSWLCLGSCIKRIPANAGEDREVQAGQQVEFALAQDVPKGTSVTWSFGDGNKKTGAVVRHAFHQAGSYKVVLSVLDSDGQQREDTALIQVSRPAIEEVIPSAADYLVLFGQPAKRLAQLPDFVENLLGSSTEETAVLAAVRGVLGFDLFTAEGLKAAGLDPEGGLALVGLEQGREQVLMASLLPSNAYRQTLRDLLRRSGEMLQQPAKDDMAISVIKNGKTGQVVAAYTLWYGHLWIVPRGVADPVKVLLKLKASSVQKGLGNNADFALALKRSDVRPAVLVLISKQALLQPLASEPDLSGLSDSIRYLRTDLQLGAKNLALSLNFGINKQPFEPVVKAFRARNAVPAFRRLIPPKSQLVCKLSMDLPGLVKALASLLGKPEAYSQALSSVVGLARGKTDQVQSGLVENLGDSSLLALRFAKPSSKVSSFWSSLEGVIYLQVRSAEQFIKSIRSIKVPQLTLIKANGRGRYRFLPGRLDWYLSTTPGFVLIASSKKLLAASLNRVLGKTSVSEDVSGWPSELESTDRQVLYVDLQSVIAQLPQLKLAPDSWVAVVRRVVTESMPQLGRFRALLLSAWLNDQALTLHSDLRLQ